MRKALSLLAVIALFAVITVPSFAAEDGAALYKAKCAGCHKADGSGNPGMKAPAIAGKSAADVTTALNTNPKHAALKKSLTDDQIKAISDYVASMK
jgi:mono/diheme cytochrome c family protein